ncbi:MAG: DUF3299 domain-containing protein [Burkholderiales bacterium]|nr:DUF3299 domain-containing protein [Burkholderiales bacterium]
MTRPAPHASPRRRIIQALLAAAATAAGARAGLAQERGSYKLGDRLAPGTARSGAAYREINWDMLIPPGWDPAAAFKGLDLANLKDGDPRAMEAMARVQEVWDQAPLNQEMHNLKVRIPGFVVPLERRGTLIYEFLLVPYFGACIHTPPPPANQIIHVFPARPVTDVIAMDPVWVSGPIENKRSATTMGRAGYRMGADLVAPYKKR